MLGSGKILSSHSSVFSFHTFLTAAPSPSFIFPLSIFHLPLIFSNPTSRSPSILAVHSPFLASLMFFHLSLPLSFTSMSASILTMWPAHFTLLLTNLPVELFLLHHIFPQVVHLLSSTLFVRVIRQNQNQPCSCCCSVNATVSSYRLRHACVTHALRTFLFSFFKMFLSNMTPSTFPRAFAPCCIRASHFYL